uniref:Histone-lysine N-methyltransferase n=1 Tax=Anopheles atroparvus TaxID=41427 RepID=A0A182JKS7_ANOAO
MSLANGMASSTGGPVPVSMPASTITITPSQPASITLPTAPYPMPLYSNIPTNVVNPIQQTTGSNNTISSSTCNSNTVQNRPTNRVLPMQASVMLQKNPDLPQTPPPAPLKVPLNHHQPCSEKMEDISIIPSHQPNTPFSTTPVSSPNDPNDPQIEIKPILPTIDGNSSTQAAGMQSPLSSGSPGMQLNPASEMQQPLTPTAEMIQIEAQHELDTATQRIDELKHSLEAETQEMLAEGHESMGTGDGGDSGVTSPSLNDESDSPEIKDKISEILDNLEQQTNQENGGLNHQSDEMQLQSYADLGQAKEQISQEQTNALLEALSPASQQQQLHQQTLETEAECAAETERIVAELNEEFRSAATSPSAATTASTVPMGSEQQAAQSSCMVSASSLEQSLMTISSSMFDTKKHEVCFTSDLAGYNGLTTSGGMDIDSDLLNDGDAESVLFGKIRQPEPSPLSQPSPTQHHQQLQLDEELQQYTVMPPLAPLKQTTVPRSTSPKLLYEIQSQDGFTYKSTSIAEIWDKLFEAVQIARRAHGLTALPEGQLKEMAGVQMLGLKTNAIRYLLEQLPGVEKCTQYNPLYHKKQPPGVGAGSNGVGASVNGLLNGGGNLPAHADYFDDLKENPYGTARCEPYSSRSEYDMFSWLASRHRKQPMPIVAQTIDDTIIPRRGSGSNLPMAMRYRTLKESSKESVGVYRSHIHGRGLFCNRDIEAGEMVIEYAGELIRSTLTDKRERYYDSRGIGCYMFKIDENFVVDATMRGNAARFINHSCEPNCYSKVVDILGHKHIIIFALRRIVQGEELTYDYKFPFEDVKIPCSCGSKKCRKYLN